MADFRKQQGLVYKEFDRTKHIYNERPERPIIEVIAGIDWGYQNPTAVIKIERDYDNHYWVSEEWYRRGKVTAEIVEYAKTMRIDAFYPDPAEPDRLEEAKRLGLVIREANKDVEKGIDSVRNLLKNNRLHIHRSCAQLINEFETYAYKEKKPEHNEPEEPIKENDHGLDALRYALFMQAPVVDFAYESQVLQRRMNQRTFQ
jgi:phage terminase large subunit